jgi:hypothetical protein
MMAMTMAWLAERGVYQIFLSNANDSYLQFDFQSDCDHRAIAAQIPKLGMPLDTLVLSIN